MKTQKVMKSSNDMKYVVFCNGTVGISVGEVTQILNSLSGPIENHKSEEARLLRDQLDNYFCLSMGMEETQIMAKYPNNKTIICYNSITVIKIVDGMNKLIGKKFMSASNKAERAVISEIMNRVLDFLFAMATMGLDNVAGSAVVKDHISKGENEWK